MRQNIKLTVKYTENSAHIIYESENGWQEICRILYPRDGQFADNIECGEAVKNLLKRRIRKSL